MQPGGGLLKPKHVHATGFCTSNIQVVFHRHKSLFYCLEVWKLECSVLPSMICFTLFQTLKVVSWKEIKLLPVLLIQ